MSVLILIFSLVSAKMDIVAARRSRPWPSRSNSRRQPGRGAVPLFFKKFENRCHVVALYSVSYNSDKIHRMLTMTPAIVAGVSRALWSAGNTVDLIDEQEARSAQNLADRLVG
jgi:hypothetical protein